MSSISTYVGLDVHKSSISIAAAASDPRSTADFHGRLPNDMGRLLRKLALFGAPSSVRVCYEAGPTGYRLARRLIAEGYSCIVIAPAKTPKAGSDRVKTDRRDAIKLATFLRNGLLTEVRIPTEDEEALRDVIRTREDLKRDESDLRRRLMALMLRHDRIWPEKSNWTKAHMKWLEMQEFERRGTTESKLCYLEQIKHHQRTVADLDAVIKDVALTGEQANLVHAFCAFRGFSILTAATIASEIGDFKRFETPSKLMSFTGLTPSESSTGDTRRRGRITKAGNTRVRTLFVEAAMHYSHAPRESVDLKRRSEGVHQSVKDIAMKAQKRLWRRRNKMLAAGKSPKKVTVALARELVGFIWAVAQEDHLTETED